MRHVVVLAAAVLAGCGAIAMPPTPSPTIAGSPSSNPDATEPVALPDPAITPGVVLTDDPSRICVSGYTQTVRVSLTVAERDHVDTAYGWTYRHGAQEYDHLIPLELGGGNGTANIWPEPITEARMKDRLENELHAKACAAHAPDAFDAAQSCIRVDWYACWIAEGRP